MPVTRALVWTISVAVLLQASVAIRVPPVWPKDRAEITDDTYQPDGRYHTLPDFGEVATPRYSSSYNSNKNNLQSPWIPIVPTKSKPLPKKPVKTNSRYQPRGHSKSATEYNPRSNYKSPVSEHEIPRDIPTKPIYPGEGQWARPGKKHRPYIDVPLKPTRPKDYDSRPDGYDTFERGQKRFKSARNKFRHDLDYFPKKHNYARKQKHQDIVEEEQYRGPATTTEFTPVKSYAQVRRTETMKRINKNGDDDEELKNEPRLKEIIKDTKAHTVYTEEGYEDSAYDHAGHEKNAEESEKYNEHEKGLEEKRKRKERKKDDAYQEEQGRTHGEEVVDKDHTSSENANSEDSHDSEKYYDKLETFERDDDSESEGTDFQDKKPTMERWGKARLAKETKETTIKDMGNGAMDMEVRSEIKLMSTPENGKQRHKFIKITPNYKRVKISMSKRNKTDSDETTTVLPQSTKRLKRSADVENIDSVKYPYYQVMKKEPVLNESPLKYAENLKLIPVKRANNMAFYDSRKGIVCPGIDETVDPIPERIKNQTEGEETGSTPGETVKPRLGQLGSKIDCLKLKFFGADPLDSPFFSEPVAESVGDSRLNIQLSDQPEEIKKPTEGKKLRKRDKTKKAIVKKDNEIQVQQTKYLPKNIYEQIDISDNSGPGETTPQLEDEPKISDFISNLTSIVDDEPAVDVVNVHPKSLQVESLLQPNVRNAKLSDLVADPKNFDNHNRRHYIDSEVHYKDEINPLEQINVFSDVLKTILSSPQETQSESRPHPGVVVNINQKGQQLIRPKVKTTSTSAPKTKRVKNTADKDKLSQELILKELITSLSHDGEGQESWVKPMGGGDFTKPSYFEFNYPLPKEKSKPMNYYVVPGMRPPVPNQQFLVYSDYVIAPKRGSRNEKARNKRAIKQYTEIRTLNRKLPVFKQEEPPEEDSDEAEEEVEEIRPVYKHSEVKTTAKPEPVVHKKYDNDAAVKGFVALISTINEKLKHDNDSDLLTTTTTPSTTTQKLIIVTGTGLPEYIKLLDKLKEYNKKTTTTTEQPEIVDASTTRTLLPPSSEEDDPFHRPLTTPIYQARVGTTTEKSVQKLIEEAQTHDLSDYLPGQKNFRDKINTQIDYSKYKTIERSPMRHNYSSRYNAEEDDLPLTREQTTQTPVIYRGRPPVVEEDEEEEEEEEEDEIEVTTKRVQFTLRPKTTTTSTTTTTTTTTTKAPVTRRPVSRRRSTTSKVDPPPPTTTATTQRSSYSSATRGRIRFRGTPAAPTTTTTERTTPPRSRRRRPSTPTTTDSSLAAAESVNSAYHRRSQNIFSNPLRKNTSVVPANHKAEYTEVTTKTPQVNAIRPIVVEPLNATAERHQEPQSVDIIVGTDNEDAYIADDPVEIVEYYTEKPRRVQKYQKHRITSEYVETSVFNPDADEAERENDELEAEHDKDVLLNNDEVDDAVEVFQRFSPSQRHGGNYRPVAESSDVIETQWQPVARQRGVQSQQTGVQRFTDIVPKPIAFYSDPMLASLVNQLGSSSGSSSTEASLKYPNLARIVNGLQDRP